MHTENKSLTVVLGMHRSGTSIITRALKVFGIELGENLMPPKDDNEKGFWENLDINSLNIDILKYLNSDYGTIAPILPEFINQYNLEEFKKDAISLLTNLMKSSNVFGLKDPRITRLLPFWQSVFDDLKLNVKYIIALRNPHSIAHSLNKRDGFSHLKSYTLWQEYTLLSLIQTFGKSRIIVDYDRMMLNTSYELNRIAKKLNLKFDEKSPQFIEYQNEFLDQRLQHFYFKKEDFLADPRISNEMIQLFNLTLECANDQRDLESEETKLILDNLLFSLRNNEFMLRYVKNLEGQIHDQSDLKNKIESLEKEIFKQNNQFSQLIETIAIPNSSLLKNQLRGEWYLKKNEDILKAGIDSYEHWLTNGKNEGRIVSPDLIGFAKNLMMEREASLNKIIEKKEQTFYEQLSQNHYYNNAQAQVGIIKALTEHSANTEELLHSLFDKKKYKLLEQLSQLREKQCEQEARLYSAIETKEQNIMARISQLEQSISGELLNLNNKLSVNKITRLIHHCFSYLSSNFKWKKPKQNNHEYSLRSGYDEDRKISESNKIISYLTKPSKFSLQDTGYCLTNIMYYIWRTRTDLQNNFNINTHDGLIEFCKWFLLSGQNEYGLPPNIYSINLLKELSVDCGQVGEKARLILNAQIKQHNEKEETENSFQVGSEVSANLIGYAFGEFGRGEDIRMLAHSLDVTGTPFCIINQITEGEVTDDKFKNWIVHNPKYHINIFNVNADVFVPLYFKLGNDFFHKRYNIGYWAWELSECPNEFDMALNMVDEVWSISNFVTDSFKTKSPVPVITMPLAVSVPDLNTAVYTKSFYTLPEDKFIFLFIFDASSYLERKNPIAVVHAFKFAFPDKKEKVHLVIKTMNTKPNNILWEKLLNAISNDERITLINKRLPRHETLGLNLACDAFISLHRAEGFGRCIAEAMAYGKPVITTNYSGSRDFANEDTACVVDYTLIPVAEESYPFSTDQVWAEPDIIQAAKYMQRLVYDKAFRIHKGEAGQKFVLENFNEVVIGKKYLERLEIIHNGKFNQLKVENKKINILKNSTVLFTIVSRNYLAYARTLLKSVRAVHPEFHLFVCLVDTIDNYFNPDEEIYSIVQADQLNIPSFTDMTIRYDIMELNTAVKPFMFQWLFDNCDIENAIYLDPDIKVYSPLDELLIEFKLGASVILTPHITKPLEDDKLPNEHSILKSGVFNLGFMAVRRCAETIDFIDWWGKKLLTQAVSDVANNLFTDQRWCDFAPCFIKNLKVIKHSGFNVAYWNLSHSNIEKQNKNSWKVNNNPLVFFHFSGIDPEKREIISKHQNRFNWTNINSDCQDLFNDYIEDLLENGWQVTRHWPYAYGLIGNVPLTTILRHFYRRENPTPREVVNLDIESYLVNLCNQPFNEKNKSITYLMDFIYSVRPDLQSAFNLLSTEGCDEFVNWFKCSAESEYGIPECLI